MKKIKVNKQSHSSNQKVGMGDFQGTAVRNNIGRSIEIMGMDMKKSTPKKIKTAPKTLA